MVSRRAEQLCLRTQHRIVTTVEDSVLRTEMESNEPYRNSTLESVYIYKDRDVLGTIKLTAKDLRRILIHGKHFPFLTPEEGEKGGSGHWETMMWETYDISVWDTTRELGFPVTKDRDTVKSARDAAEGRRTNFVLSPEILRFCRQVLGEGDPGTEPTQCMRIVWELVDQ